MDSEAVVLPSRVGGWRTAAALVATGAGAAFWWMHRMYLPPFGRRLRRSDPPVVCGDLLGGVANALERNQQGFLAECHQQYGNIFTLRLQAGNVHDMFEEASTVRMFVKKLFKALWQGFKYQVVILDPYSANAVFKSDVVDGIPSSRQGILRFNVPKLMSTSGGVRSLSSHIRKSHAGHGYEEFLRAANSVYQEQVRKSFPVVDKLTPAESLQAAVGGLVLPAFMNLFHGQGFASEETQRLFHIYERDIRFRIHGLDGRALLKDVESMLARELTSEKLRERKQVSHLTWRLEEMMTDFGIPEDEVCRMRLAVLWGANINLPNTVTWAILHIVHEPEVLRSVELELKTNLENRYMCKDWKKAIRNGKLAVDKRDLEKLVRLSSVVWEVTRRYGKTNVLRSTAHDAVITVAQPHQHGHKEERFAIRQGDWISAFPQFWHRDPRFFDDPMDFKPFRFLKAGGDEVKVMEERLKEDVADTCDVRCKSARRGSTTRLASIDDTTIRMKDRLQALLVPFGLGNRTTCPASSMAMDLVKILVIQILATVMLTVDGPVPAEFAGGVNQVPPPMVAVPYMYQRLADEQLQLSEESLGM